MESLPSISMATGFLMTAPTPRIAISGWLIIGVPKIGPKTP